MDWYWLVIFAGLMFVMHRFGLGCCGGHSHGGHGHGQDPAKGELPDRAGGPAKQARPVMASAGGNGTGMSCCGGHADGGPQETPGEQDVESIPRAAEEKEGGRPMPTVLRPGTGERKGDG